MNTKLLSEDLRTFRGVTEVKYESDWKGIMPPTLLEIGLLKFNIRLNLK
jgi:hypothetical protein